MARDYNYSFTAYDKCVIIYKHKKTQKIGWYLGLIFGICLFIEFGRAYWILTSRLALFEKVGIKTMARGLVLSSLFVGGILGELLTYIGLRKNYFYHSNGK